MAIPLIANIPENEIRVNHLPKQATLWRYLTKEKVESLMETGKFWFSQVASFADDPLEGRRPEESMLSQGERDFFEKYNVTGYGEQYPGAKDEQRAMYYALCWHINHKENRRMWSEYCQKTNDSLAIVTSHKALNEWRKQNVWDAEVWAGPVTYRSRIDPQPMWRYEDQYFYKNAESFSWEREFRILTRIANADLGVSRTKAEVAKRMIPFNSRKWIHRIVFHPKASDTFKKEIRSKAKKFFPRLKSIEDSSLIC